MIQIEWFCEDCKANHFGNCPKMQVEITHSAALTPPDSTRPKEGSDASLD